jgi:hypothetical protein
LWEGRKEALWAVEQKSLENSRKIQRLQMWREAEEWDIENIVNAVAYFDSAALCSKLLSCVNCPSI